MRRSRLVLERELAGLLGKGRDARIAARYYGFDGHGGCSLQAVGDEFGLTRERIRQILVGVAISLTGRRHSTPVLDRAISFVADRMPAAASTIEAGLFSEGAVPFRIEGIVNAAEMLGKPLSFRITEARGERVIHARQDTDSFDRVIGLARRNVRHWGMSTISRIAEDPSRLKPDAGRGLVAGILSSQEGFHWLDEDREWFFFSNVAGNRVLTRIAKILSVASPIRVADLRVGIARDYKMQDWLPPDAVLLQLCRHIDGVRVSGSAITAEPAISPKDVLCGIERDIVRVLAENGGCMPRAQFMETFLRRGIKHCTLYAHLTYSPIIYKPSRGYCGLIGRSL